MRIAFDAKRAFLNRTGLGQYSRTLINSLIQYHSEHSYYLATPRTDTSLYKLPNENDVHVISPSGFYKNKPFDSLWRSWHMKKELIAKEVDLFHGLSHEIPVGIHRTKIKSVVTMHDLIFERYPHQYKSADVSIYRKKFKYACYHADKVIAISNQTKEDLISYYNVPDEKIEVCYQSCDPIFNKQLNKEELQYVKEKYNLPSEYILYVGSIIERKNLLNICKALSALGKKLDIPLIVVGEGKAYAEKVKEYIQENGLTERVIFLSEEMDRGNIREPYDLPGVYQLATMFIYPSVFEGFGIPVLESLNSKTPVITSNISCLPEAGGDAAYYIDPNSIDEMSHAIWTVLTNEQLRAELIQKGLKHAEKFTTKRTSSKVMQVYSSLS